MEQPPVNCVAPLSLFILWSSLNKCLSLHTQTHYSTHTHNGQTCLDTPTHSLLLFLQSSHPFAKIAASHTLGTISPSFLWYAPGEKNLTYAGNLQAKFPILCITVPFLSYCISTVCVLKGNQSHAMLTQWKNFDELIHKLFFPLRLLIIHDFLSRLWHPFQTLLNLQSARAVLAALRHLLPPFTFLHLLQSISLCLCNSSLSLLLTQAFTSTGCFYQWPTMIFTICVHNWYICFHQSWYKEHVKLY